MLHTVPAAHIVLLLPLLLQLVGLAFAVLIDPYIEKKHRSVMLIVVAFVFSLIAQDYAGYLLDLDGTLPLARTAVGIYGYSVRPMIPVLFYYIVGKRKSFWPAWILLAVNAGVHLTALFSGVCFRIDENNHFIRGPLGFCCHVVSAVLLVNLLALSVKNHHRARKRETLIPIGNAVLIVAAVIADTFAPYRSCPLSFLTIAVVSSCVFYYIWLHMQFVREHEQALMAERRIQIMMSQIRPHFLFNTLSTIQALCKTDPDKAFTTTGKFGDYLRQNIESLNRTDLIPMRKELEHIRIYAEIEAIRFPSVQVVYDTPDLDFTIPALTVQPLVENAIRHGVRIREQGVVTVTTRKTAAGHEITVRDNGRGFDVSALETADDTHIGLKNVRERVEQMCGGTLHVESEPGKGAAVTIRIPARADAG